MERGAAEAVSAEMHRLSNGLTVAVDPLSNAESVALGVYAMVGSRSEPDHLNGLAHVVEHMVFKGAGSRDTRQIAEAIEDVGGIINAWTARDQTVFYGRTLAKDAPLLAELIADFLRAPHLDEEHLEREKTVILSELGEVIDSPDDLVHDHLFEAAFEGQPLGRSVLGRAETLGSITAEDCRNWLRDELIPSRLILSASGKLDPEEILAIAERLFGDMEDWPGVPIGRAEFTGGLRNDRREFEQAHWCLGLPGFAASDPRLPALSLFVQALGGGMSSRLFQELREERGLAYSVSAWQQAYGDAGIVALSCAADRNRAVESMHLARAVLADAVETLTDTEVNRARAQLEAGLLMGMESAQGRAEQMARSIEVFGRILPLDELLGRKHFFVAVRPAQPREIVDERLGKIAVLFVLHHADRAVSLGQALAIGTENHRNVCELRQRRAERFEDVDLARRVVDVVVAADNVRDVHVQIVHHHAEIVRGHAIGTHDDQVVQLCVLHDDGAFHEVVENYFAIETILEADHRCHARRRGFALRVLGPPATVVARLLAASALSFAHRIEVFLARVAMIGLALANQLLRDLGIALETVHLIDGPLVVVEPQPLHRVEDGLRGFLRGALAIRVFDAQDELAAELAGVRP